jgi:hypothetical protein
MYHSMLRGMVERRMRNSIHMVGSIWYTAWVDAGQPDLRKLIDYEPTGEELEKRRQEILTLKEERLAAREHDH